MVYNRVYQRRRRNAGWLPRYEKGRVTREEAADRGSQQLERLAQRIQAYTGASLESRRALDFGCGWGRLAIPLAERCEHVYGVDISPAVLQKAERGAEEANVTNVEWLQTESLSTLSGRYDLLISTHVFQHIPSREGEQLLTTLVHGLSQGGVAAINLVLRPSHPWLELLPWAKRQSRSLPDRPGTSHGRSGSRLKLLRKHRHMLMGAYSLNRLGELLADEGILVWHVRFIRKAGAYDSATIFFRKD
jgi:2-polyprenyl-3-methyl-5-hydroxy-6-metoxy-1,4-benzoquinol methylase